MNEIIKELKIAKQILGDCKVLVRHKAEEGRLLPREEEIHMAQDLIMEIDSDVSVMVDYLKTFERLSFASNQYFSNRSGQTLEDFGKKLDEAIN